MGEISYMRGNQAAGLGAKLARIEVMGCYPIPPSSEVMEQIRTYIDKGELKCGYVETEGEKSSHLVTYGAALAGVRAFNATSGQGIAYMMEGLHLQSGTRTPAVIAVANRTLFAPHGMHPDHQDTVSARDAGWIQFHCESVQEILDTIIQAFKVVEHEEVMLPAFVCYDGYYLSHSLEKIDIPDQKEVDDFLPTYHPGECSYIAPNGLAMSTSGPMYDPWMTEFRYIAYMALNRTAKRVINEVDDEFGKKFGRKYGGLIDSYLTEDAEVLLVTTGSNTATARFTTDIMRRNGKKIGVIKIRVFRPYPREALCELLEKSKARVVIVLDRSPFGAYTDEAMAALFNLKDKPLVKGFICGQCGRDITPYNIIDMATQGFDIARKGYVDQPVEFYFLRKKEG